MVSAAGGSLESETRLLRDASLELRASHPERALRLLDDHARSFSGGALVEERRAERILALCALGRAAEARAESESFLQERPRSLLADRVRASCAHTPEGSEKP
jgi:RNA polymerase sigma-70 factor (ECF subfamily)